MKIKILTQWEEKSNRSENNPTGKINLEAGSILENKPNSPLLFKQMDGKKALFFGGYPSLDSDIQKFVKEGKIEIVKGGE